MVNKQIIEISPKTIWYTVLIIAGAWFLFAIKDILLLLFLAILLSSAIQPIVDRLERRRIPRVLSTVIIYILIWLILAWSIKTIVPALLQEFREIRTVGESYLGNVFSWWSVNWSKWFGEWSFNNDSGNLTNWGLNIFSNTLNFFSGFLKAMVVFSLSFYMIVKEDGAWGFVKNVVPRKYEKYAINLIKRIQYQVGRWMIGQIILVVIIFVLDYLVLSLLNIPLALTLALLGGLLEVIPYIGPTLSVLPAMLIGLTISPLTAIIILLAYILIQQIENHVIVPLLMKKAVGLNPVVIILVLLIGGKLAGVPGLILAVPLAAAGSIVWDDFVNRGAKVSSE